MTGGVIISDKFVSFCRTEGWRGPPARRGPPPDPDQGQAEIIQLETEISVMHLDKNEILHCFHILDLSNILLTR